MQSQILAKKPIYRKNGEDIVDLTYPVIQYKGDSIITNIILVDESMEMRPELVSYAAYGIIDNWDLILKFNGISNPFSLQQGQYLLIPDLSYMTSQIITDSTTKNAAQNVQNQHINASKQTKIDPKKIVYDQMVNNLINQISKYNLPPNIAEPGKKEITIKDGKIYLGGKD